MVLLSLANLFRFVSQFRSRLSLAPVLILITCAPVVGQEFGKMQREYGRSMLSMIQTDIEKNYYDPTFHGIDLKARFAAADDRIKQARSNGEIFGIIAQLLLDFDDSHLFFSPPPRASDVKYGWLMQMIGDKCFITAVQPGSDAERQGIRPGDQVVDLDGFQPSRDIIWKMEYLYYSLKPRASVRMTVVNPEGKQRQLDVAAQVKQKAKMVDLTDFRLWAIRAAEAQAEDRLNRDRFEELGDEVFIWKMPGFDEYDDAKVDQIVARAKKHNSLILDLRGNGGGYVKMLNRLVANIMDHDVNIGEERRRKATKMLIAKSRGAEAFKGKIVIIVDSQCASAAEVFPRIMQLEKRAIVIGDRTSGSVMESSRFSHSVGQEIVTPYAVSVTIADLIMTDGKSLEHVGVMPDEFILPTAADLAARRDPVLARAAAILGVDLSAEKAGAFFPIEWRK